MKKYDIALQLDAQDNAGAVEDRDVLGVLELGEGCAVVDLHEELIVDVPPQAGVCAECRIGF